MNILEQAGLHHYLKKTQQDGLATPNTLVGRIVAEYGSRYDVLTAEGTRTGVAPKTLITSLSHNERPKTGDWVVYERLAHEGKLRIVKALPRYSELSRKRAGKRLEAQTIAANVDVVFIVESVTTPFDADRIERFLVVPETAHIQAVLLLNKADTLAPAPLHQYYTEAQNRFPTLPIVATSIKTGLGIAELKAHIHSGQTIALIGPSGVGKSSLINSLADSSLATAQVRHTDQKGRHTTTVRELLLMPEGGVIIDTPGMRELQLWGDADTTLDTAFADIEQMSRECRFSNCDHVRSKGCAIQAALKNGSLTEVRFASYLKLKRELAHHASKIDYEVGLEKRRREKKIHRDLKKIIQHKRQS